MLGINSRLREKDATDGRTGALQRDIRSQQYNQHEEDESSGSYFSKIKIFLGLNVSQADQSAQDEAVLSLENTNSPRVLESDHAKNRDN